MKSLSALGHQFKSGPSWQRSIVCTGCGVELSWQVQPTACWSLVHAIVVHQFRLPLAHAVLIEMKDVKSDPTWTMISVSGL